MEKYTSKNLDHLGIVSGFCESLGLKQLVNEALGSDTREKLSAGEVLTLMVINGLGFTTKPLYLTAHFYSSKPLGNLLSRELSDEQISDDKLGRVLDKIYEYGAEKLFATISASAVTKFGIDTSWRHLDTTSMSLSGDYDKADREDAEIVSYGHSKDHRPDLKQFMVSMICSQDGGIPLLEQTLKGNTSDVNHFRKTLSSLRKSFNSSDTPEYYVVDSAMYNRETIAALGASTKWVSRVPKSLNEAKSLTLTSKEELEPLGEGYSGKEFWSTYGGVQQRWFLIHSEQAYQRDLSTLAKKIDKEEEKNRSELKKLCATEFACARDATREVSKFSKKLKYHQFLGFKVESKKKYHHRGKPTPSSPYDVYYKVHGTLERDQNSIASEQDKKGFFILATNILKEDNADLEIVDFLKNYKGQQRVERGFRFLKSKEFLADSVFLKKQSRIISLSMLMCLCLLIYTLAERTLRLELSAQGKTLPNQVGKEVRNPTMRWIFQLFEGVSVLFKKVGDQIQTMVLNLKQVHTRVIELLGEHVANIYLT